MRIAPARTAADVLAAAGLLDGPPRREATEGFLASPSHHLLLAYDDGSDAPVGFVSGVETTHPDKGTEMFLSELGVAEGARRRGIATALVRELRELARARGCHAMWTATEPGNAAAVATYRRAGAAEEEPVVSLGWSFQSKPTRRPESSTSK